MTDWCHIRVSVVGKPENVKAFVKRAEGKDLLWKDGKGPAFLGHVTVPLSFHALAPLRPNTLDGPYDPVGIGEEKRQWGCKWSAFETEFEMVNKGHALYEFETANGVPANLFKTCSGRFDVKIYVSHWSDIIDGQRGRDIYFRHEVYAMRQNASPLTLGSRETPQNFAKRQEIWLHETFNNHLEWVKGMTE